MVEWLSFGRIGGWFASKGWGRVKKRALDKRQLVDETAPFVSEVREFIGQRATPMQASFEWQPGDTAAKVKSWHESWGVLRPKLIAAVDRNPSDKVQKLGHELAEDVEKLRHAFRYMASTFTGTADTAYASQSAQERHDHALALADELLQTVRNY